MLPSSHSFSGRWTCRSTARIKLRGQRLCFFERDRVADVDRFAQDHASDHASPADEFVFQPHPDLIHAKARLADVRDLEHRARSQPDSGADRHDHDIEPIDRQILFDDSWAYANLVERLLVGEQYLAIRARDGVFIAIKTKPGDQLGILDIPHRLAGPGAELDRHDARWHGLQIVG